MPSVERLFQALQARSAAAALGLAQVGGGVGGVGESNEATTEPL